jgi:tetratricopeptide (TPR) repeat protein
MELFAQTRRHGVEGIRQLSEFVPVSDVDPIAEVLRGDTPRAVSLLRQAIISDPRDVALYLDFAGISMDHQSFPAGIAMINSGLVLQPNVAALYVARGILYVQLAQYDQAEADFEKADALDPKRSIGSAALGSGEGRGDSARGRCHLVSMEQMSARIVGQPIVAAAGY